MRLCFRCSGLRGNPLAPDLVNIYNQMNGTQKLLTFLLDHLSSDCKYIFTKKILAMPAAAVGYCGLLYWIAVVVEDFFIWKYL